MLGSNLRVGMKVRTARPKFRSSEVGTVTGFAKRSGMGSRGRYSYRLAEVTFPDGRVFRIMPYWLGEVV